MMRMTPITLLKEICSKNQETTPEYSLESEIGPVHAPNFVYRVKCNVEEPISVTGSGSSKKLAKHHAALAALEKIDIATIDAELLSEYEKLKVEYMVAKETAVQTAEASNDSNPVGKLMELCVKKKWAPPNYPEELLVIEGAAHSRKFEMTCVLRVDDENLEKQGKGNSKKSAKREAAGEMLKLLQALGHYDPAMHPPKAKVVTTQEETKIEYTKDQLEKRRDYLNSIQPIYRKTYNEEMKKMQENGQIVYLQLVQKICSVLNWVIKFKSFTVSSGTLLTSVTLKASNPSIYDRIGIAVGSGMADNEQDGEEKASRSVLTLIDHLLRDAEYP